MVKDFLNQSLGLTNHFKNFGFTPMHVEPNMILELDTNWKTFEDYKKALKSKYRIKVNKADKTSKTLTARIFSESDFATYKEELQKLYENTIANANFNAQVLDLNTYIKLRAIYHENFIVKAYFIKDTDQKEKSMVINPAKTIITPIYATLSTLEGPLAGSSLFLGTSSIFSSFRSFSVFLYLSLSSSS